MIALKAIHSAGKNNRKAADLADEAEEIYRSVVLTHNQ